MAILIHVSTIIADEQGRVLFVREAKQVNRGKWNFPGGHVEIGEHLTAAAIREVLEETTLEVTLARIVGINSGVDPAIHSIRFTFAAASYQGTASAGDDILEVQWVAPEEMVAKPDSELVGPVFLRAILRDWMAGKGYPLETISEVG